MQKVGVKTLVTAETFKSSNYVDIINRAVPEIASQKGLTVDAAEYPELKNIITLSDKRYHGMMTWDDMLDLSKGVSSDAMHERESKVTYLDDTNIQFTSGTTGYPKGVTLSHYNVVNNGLQVGQRMHITAEDNICIPVPLYHCFGCVLGNQVAIN